jgi:hypothetical protein
VNDALEVALIHWRVLNIVARESLDVIPRIACLGVQGS